MSSLLDAFLFEREARPIRNIRRGRDESHFAAVLHEQFGQHAAHVIMIVIVNKHVLQLQGQAIGLHNDHRG